MITVCDVNAVWRARFAEALADIGAGVLAAAPRAIGGRSTAATGPRLPPLDVILPLGWATRLRWLAQPMLARALGRSDPGDALVVTTPHYLPLVRLLRRRRRVVYLCSDDYRSYEGWNPDWIARTERALLGLVDHALFVSSALAERAVAERSIARARVSVSMNATEPRFLADDPVAIPEFALLPRPVVGSIGALNRRIDLSLLRRTAALPAVGTLLLVGPVDPSLADDPDMRALAAHPRVRLTGPVPHGEIDRWMRALDVALLPYAPTALNHFCSPMRLFDHLATGVPIVATRHVDQVHAFAAQVAVAASDGAFLDAVSAVAAAPVRSGARRAFAAAHLWTERARAALPMIAAS